MENNTQSTVGTWATTTDDHDSYNSGRFFGSVLMLPAAGYRYSSGGFGYRGYCGYYWSSSEYSSSKAWYLYSFSGFSGTSSYGGRLLGFPVRCISE